MENNLIKIIEEQLNSSDSEGLMMLDGVSSNLPECYDVDIFEEINKKLEENEQER